MSFKKIWEKRALAFALCLCLGLSTWMAVPAGAVSFTDVKPTDAAYPAITWAVSNDITNGVSEGVFAPQATCNNGQIITYLGTHSQTSRRTITITMQLFGPTKMEFLMGQFSMLELPVRAWIQ